LLILACIASGGALSQAQAASASAAVHAATQKADVSREIVDATIARLPTAADLGPWEYSRALFLLGELSVYRRTHDPKYLHYAEAWADSHTGANGKIDHPIDALDFIMPGNVDITLYEMTGDARYKVTADGIAKTFASYPRTEDGGLWHATNDGREHQLWADGTFMALPFMVRSGVLEGHPAASDSEAMEQLVVYYKHLHDPNGPLLFHAYDESDTAAWVDKATHHSTIKWSRAIGWYCMALVQVLDALPEKLPTAQDRAMRQQLIVIAQTLAHDLAQLQDPKTGLWSQIIDKPSLPGNFLETSGSCMFTYFLDDAVKHGYIDASYHDAAMRGYKGVMSRVSLGADGLYHISGICEGTNVGTQNDYLTRKVYTDDFHGLGAFLLMNEEVSYNLPAMQIAKADR